MEWNTQKLRAGEKLKKNKLYELTEENPAAVFTEEHEDSVPEVVEVEFRLPQSGKAVVAWEYRNKDYKSSKAPDILCILADDSRQELRTYIYDIKRTITGYDETKSLKELHREVVDRIEEFTIQMRDGVIHKEGLTAWYRYLGYMETVNPGIITTRFDREKLLRLSKRLEDALEEPSPEHGMIGKKYLIATLALRKDAEIIRNFADKKIKLWNQLYDLQVVLLEYSEGRNARYQRIVIGG